MQKELEVKILNVEVDKIRKKLEDIGAKFIREEKQINYTFKSQKINIEKGSYLRIRTTIIENKKENELTYKKKSYSKQMRAYDEYTTKISNVKNTIEILKNLGYEIEYKGYKKRIIYKINTTEFDIDIWDKDTYPYPYMEIEVENENDLSKLIKKLNIKKEDISTLSISQLREKLK